LEKKSIKDFQEFSEERFTKRVMFNDGGSTVFILNFQPGQKLPPHKHPGTEVYLLTLDGSGTFTIDGNQTSVNPNDAVHLSGEEEMSFENTGSSPVSLYVMLNKVPDERYTQNI
jgi:quercetin dioxygenase-like cupin family protein